MKRLIIITLLFFCGHLSFAQAPWNAKVMLHNPIYGNVDTVWIGCDSAGAWGYQEGLDVIDTTLDTPFGLWSDDSLITDGCFNLKKDVKNFVTGIQYYNLQMIDSGSFLPSDYIKIDTNEFKFDNGNYKITGAGIIVLDGTGYVMAFDINYWDFYVGDTTDLDEDPFYTDSITLIPEGSYFNLCIQSPFPQMRILLWVAFNYYYVTSNDAILNVEPNTIFPNPTNGKVYLSSFNHFNNFILFDVLGRKKLLGNIAYDDNHGVIDLSSAPAGTYLLYITDQNTRHEVIKQIIVK